MITKHTHCIGLDANVQVQKSKISIKAGLKDITVYDPAPDALYPKVCSNSN